MIEKNGQNCAEENRRKRALEIIDSLGIELFDDDGHERGTNSIFSDLSFALGRIKFPRSATCRKWALCPICGKKTVLYDDNAECHGVYCVCNRGCRREFMLEVSNGEQIK